MRKVIIYIAASIDGYIAGPGGDLDFLSLVRQEGEDYGYSRFIETIDTVILGRKTFDWVIKHAGYFPHADKETFVITHAERPVQGKITFYNGNIEILINKLKQKTGKNIYCDGGAEVITELLHADLVDELIISLIPVLLGDGIRLFKDGRPEQRLQQVSATSFTSGLVQLHYQRYNRSHDNSGHRL